MASADEIKRRLQEQGKTIQGFYDAHAARNEERRKAVQSMITEMLNMDDRNFTDNQIKWLDRLNGKMKYSDKEEKIICDIYVLKMN